MQSEPTNVDLRKIPRDELRLMRPRRELARAFDEFRIEDSQFLEEAEGRSRCTKCGQSRKYFCYSCSLPLERFEDRVPRVQLPFHVDILKHAREVSGKSTAVHAPIVAHEHVKLYTYPRIPDYRHTGEKVVLISPGPGAVKLEDLIPQSFDGSVRRSRGCVPFDRAVLIDCTWNQVKKILHDPRVAGLQRVELCQHETLFWRYQTGKPNTYLATIEALFYFVLDVHKITEHGTKTANTLEHGEINGSEQRSARHEPPVRSQNSGTQNLTMMENLQESDEKLHRRGSLLASNPSESTEYEQRSAQEQSVTARSSPGCAVQPVSSDIDMGKTMGRVHVSCGDGSGSRGLAPLESDEGRVPEPSTLPCITQDRLFIDDCCHQYDNLLFYFKFMFDKIHSMYGVENLRAYK